MLEIYKLWKRKTLPALLAFSLIPIIAMVVMKTYGYSLSWKDFLGLNPSPVFIFTPYAWSWIIPILIGVEALRVDEGLLQYTIPPLSRSKYTLLKIFSIIIMLIVVYLPSAVIFSIIYNDLMPSAYALVYALASLQISLISFIVALYASPITTVLLVFALDMLVSLLRIPASFYLGEWGYSAVPLLAPFGVVTSSSHGEAKPLFFSTLWALLFGLSLYFGIKKKDF